MLSSSIQFEQAFDAFSSADLARTALLGQERAVYAAELRDTFDDYRSREHGSLLCVGELLWINSRTPYVIYAGDQALTVEIPVNASDELTGSAAWPEGASALLGRGIKEALARCVQASAVPQIAPSAPHLQRRAHQGK